MYVISDNPRVGVDAWGTGRTGMKGRKEKEWRDGG